MLSSMGASALVSMRTCRLAYSGRSGGRFLISTGPTISASSSGRSALTFGSALMMKYHHLPSNIEILVDHAKAVVVQKFAHLVGVDVGL